MAAVAVLLSMAAGLAITGPASPASAAEAPAPHDDYSVYPSVGVFPAGCEANGGNILENVAFSRNGGAPDTLRNLEGDLQAGDLVTMTWTGFAQGCSDATISLANKRAQSPTFNVDDQQELILPFSYCGTTTDVSCANGEDGFVLTINVPSQTEACNVQLDAIVGTPLKNVGKPPYGSFYGEDLRTQNGGHAGPSTLIDAANFGGDCPNPTPSYTCATGGIQATYDNAQTYAQKVRVYNDGVLVDTVTVPAEGSTSIVVPVAEGSTFDIVSKLFESTLDYTFDENSGTRDCENPSVPTPTATCNASNGTIGLTLDNSLSHVPVTFVIRADGPNAGPLTDAFTPNTANEVTVAEGAVGAASVATGPGWYHVTVVAKATGDTLLATDVLMPCTIPSATTTPSCAAGGAIVHIANAADAGHDAVFTITKDGVQVGSTHTLAPGESADVTVPIAEDTTAKVVVSEATAGTLATTALTANCTPPPTTPPPPTNPPTQVLAEVQTPVQAAALARTGTDVKPMLFLAGILLALGGAMVAFARVQGLRLATAGTRRRRNVR